MTVNIDARCADRTDGPHQPYTVRLALHDAIRGTLHNPGDHTRINNAVGIDGKPVDVRKLQIILSQITPDGWKLTSKRDGNALDIWRLV